LSYLKNCEVHVIFISYLSIVLLSVFCRIYNNWKHATESYEKTWAALFSNFLSFMATPFSKLFLANFLFCHAKFKELGCASVDKVILPPWARNNAYPSSSLNKESQECMSIIRARYAGVLRNRVAQLPGQTTRSVYGKRSRDTNLDCVLCIRRLILARYTIYTIYFR